MTDDRRLADDGGLKYSPELFELYDFENGKMSSISDGWGRVGWVRSTLAQVAHLPPIDLP